MGEVTACGLCGWRNFQPVLDLGTQPLAENDNGKRYPLKLIRCEKCQLVQLSHIPPKEEVFPQDHLYAAGNSKERQRHFADLAEKIAVHVSGSGGLVIDIGANDGTLLRAVRKVAPGLGLLGVEPTGQARKISAEGIPVQQQYFTARLGLDISHVRRASVITACNVLAHVPDPHDFLEGVSTLLDDDGVFITENHDWNSISRGLQFDTVYHEHLRYYTLGTLTRLLEMHGLTVVDAERLQAHGGSFRLTAMKEPDGLEIKAQRARESLRELLSSLRGPVYGIGATTRATTLIHYAGLGQWLHCVCEVPWSEKIGTNIPGTLIPVVDEIRLKQDQPPYALLLSWHIRDDIVPKIRQMGYMGGIIIPLPEPRIISDECREPVVYTVKGPVPFSKVREVLGNG
jgi:hypothetical protein